jgi:conjugative relaxase-like TrwC/TraI family protein
MVVTIAKATSTDYYTGGEGVARSAESYYLDAVTEGEPPAYWSGSGAERLGLTGEVSAEDMSAVYSEHINPRTGEAIGNRPANRRSVEERLADALAVEPEALPERVEEIRHRIESDVRTNPIGWDATFSVPKSVTVAHTAVHRAELAAIRSGDTDRAARFGAIRSGIEAAIHEASAAVVAYAETVATVRTGGSAGAPTRWLAAPGLTVASFFQHTNRNIDPQLHTHIVILNRAFSADGKVRALDGKDLLAQKHALGAVGDRVLDERMAALGFEVELRPDGMARELTVVPTDVADLFSSRDRQVTDRVAQLLPAAEERAGRQLTDLELYHLKKEATLSTRRAKSAHAPETTEEMLERWWAGTVSIGTDLDQVANAIDRHLTDRTTQTTDSTAATSEAYFGDAQAAAVVAEAVAAVSEQRSTWRASDLMLEISRRLPSLGGLDAKSTVQVLTRLTNEAIAGPLARQVSGRDIDDLAEVVEADGVLATDVAAQLAADAFTRPSARLYASTDTLIAEEALRRAAIERGGHRLVAEDVHAWLDQNTPTIGDDQRTAVAGIATTDARLSVLVGPAGTGKSYTAGAFANAWGDLTAAQGTPGRVVGLAVSQAATRVLQDDGIPDARNISQWLAAQDRLARGGQATADTAWQLRPADVVMVDEASMVATADLERIQNLVSAAGARVVLTGDPRQLGAVEAGGVMGLLDGHAETYTLSEVRRFAADWEATASLQLRDGDPDALAAYDRHGRLLGYDTLDEAIEGAATAVVADRLDGRSVVVTTGTNTQAAAIASRARDTLIGLGLVEPDGVLLGRDGCTAGVGDLVAARVNDYALGVFNREQYQVTAVGDDGSLTVIPADRDRPGHPTTGDSDAAPVVLPPSYVQDNVQLGYAATIHAAEGLTVDSGHTLPDGAMDAAAQYVALTRGRLRNTAHVPLNAPAQDDTRPAALTDTGGEVRLQGHSQRGSARAVLEGNLTREQTNRAATVEAELDTERLSSMSVLAGRQEAVVRIACRERLDRHLDQLTAACVLDEQTRARLSADQGTEHLSRLLRAVEQAGQNPRQVLTDAITDPRGFTGVDSVAQILSHRITGGRPLPHPTTGEPITTDHGGAAGTDRSAPPQPEAGRGLPVPQDIAAPMAEHLEHLNRRIGQRAAALAERLAEDPPVWAREALGPVPTDEAARADWLKRAGTIAAHREATDWSHPQQPIGTMPGLAATERRASHTAAWEALGRPEAGLDETAMSEGQLRCRVRAGITERAWAPMHADDALRAAETGHEAARQAAALTRARADHALTSGDLDTAEQLRILAGEQEQLAEAKERLIDPLTTASDTRRGWAATSTVTFAEEQRAREELQRRGLPLDAGQDLTTVTEWLALEHAARQSDDQHRPITELDVHQATDDLDATSTPVVADLERLPEAPTDTAWSSAYATAGMTRTSADLGITPEDRPTQSDPERGWGRSPAHRVIPVDVTSEELETATAVTALAVARLADRASQERSYTREADRDDTFHADNVTLEAGRRRRDSAELTQPAADVRGSGLDLGASGV